MDTPTCRNPVCGQPILQRINEHWTAWQQRKFCGHLCANRVNSGKPRLACTRKAADRLEDIAWLMDAGESPDVVAARLGLTPEGLSRWLYRHGEVDLARMFIRQCSA